MRITEADIENANEVPFHKTLRARATAALATGCLALSLSPAVALAAPGDQAGQDGPQQGGNPPAAQQQALQGDWQPQGDQVNQGASQQPPSDGQQPAAGQQPADGAQAEGGPQGGSAVDDQVRQILSGQYGINATLPEGMAAGGPGAQPASGQQTASAIGVPEIPEGEVNVQAVIDTVRDVLRQHGEATFEAADYSDESFLATLAEYVQAAVGQRETLFASGAFPADAPAQQGAAPGESGVAADDGAAGDVAVADGDAAGDASDDAASSATWLDKLVGFIVGLFS